MIRLRCQNAMSRPSGARVVGAVALAAVGLGAQPASAQRAPPLEPGGVTRLGRLAGGSASVGLHPATGAIRFLRVAPGRLPAYRIAATGATAAALAFLGDHRRAFGLDDPAIDLAVASVTRDPTGATHVRFRQQRRGVPVFASDLRVHFDAAGELVAANGTIVPGLGSLSPAPAFTPNGAARLVVFHTGLVRNVTGDPRLAWEIEEARPDGGRDRIYVGAVDGRRLERFSLTPETLSRVAYDGGHDDAHKVWEEKDGAYTGGDLDVGRIIDVTRDAYDFFANLTGGATLSYNGKSAPMEGVARDPKLKCPNARWTGDYTSFCDGVAADDVIAHEWTHAYTRYTDDLVYAWQPGALNEASSDIFGETIDQLNGAGTDSPADVRADDACSASGGSLRWLIGEDAEGFTMGPVRDMWNPTCKGHPGRVGDMEYFCDVKDSGGVHRNSGVVNHAYALLVDGGTYNGHTVKGIGFLKAAHIYWRAKTTYQTPTTDFADHADALEMACKDLRTPATSLFSLTTGMPTGMTVDASDCVALAEALAAVEMRSTTPCPAMPLLDPAPPESCAGKPAVIFYVDEFEGPTTAWTLSNEGVAKSYTPRDWKAVGGLPDGRAGTAFFAVSSRSIGDCGDDVQAGAMHLESPEIALPPVTGPVRLVIDHYVATEPDYDGGNVKISVNGGPWTLLEKDDFTFNPYNTTLSTDMNDNPMQPEPVWSGTNKGTLAGSWGTSVASLDRLAKPGDKVRIRFDFGVDGCNGIDGWYLDRVAVMRCEETSGLDSPPDGGPPDAPVDSAKEPPPLPEPPPPPPVDAGPADEPPPPAEPSPDPTPPPPADAAPAADAGPPPVDLGAPGNGLADRGCSCEIGESAGLPGPRCLLAALVLLSAGARRRSPGSTR